MKENYRAWEIKEGDFPRGGSMREKLEFLVRYAILAHSSHNAQPWKFRVVPEEQKIEIYADASRHLQVSDPQGRLLAIAAGCAGEYLRIAGDAYGMACEILYPAQGLAESAENPAITVVFREAGERIYPDGLLPCMLSRASYRGSYKKEEVSEEHIARLKSATRENKAFLNIWSDAPAREELARIAAEGVGVLFARADFRKELAQWVRHNLTGEGDGMPGFGHEFSFLKSLFAPIVLPHKDFSVAEKQKTFVRLKECPAIGVVSTKSDTWVDWVHAGEVLARTWLFIEHMGMSAAILASPIEEKNARQNLQQFLTDKGESGYPQMFFCFGFPLKRAPHSPRRTLEDFLI